MTEPPARRGRSMRAGFAVAARLLGTAALAAALAGCPAPRAAYRPPPVPLETGAHHDEFALAGVVHVVRRGETLWRIARAYGIDARDLMETNGITDPRTVEVGTELFVPGATHGVEVPPAGGGEAVPATPGAGTGSTSASAAGSGRAAGPSRSSLPARAGEEAVASSPARAGGEGGASSPARPGGEGGSGAPRAGAGRGALVARAGGEGGPGAARAAPSATPLAWPLKGVLYGRYGVRGGQRHDGIDIAAPEGTPVLAAAAGTVIYSGEQPGYGAIVILRHEGGLVTLYAHNARILVDEGARVRRGEPIARVGQTGRTSGPHLHFEVRDGTRPRNPLLFLP